MTCATPPEDPRSTPAPDPEGADARRLNESAQASEGAPSAAGASPLVRLFRPDTNLEPGLYVVATPIGNLRDITLRALDVLASVDMIYAEDTRVAGKLLSAYGVSAKLRSYHDHNGAEVRPGLIRDLEGGARIALISDAGTPLVSDPGYKLVRAAVERGMVVRAVPGASTPIAALSIAGLPTDRFLFAGFPPPKSAARKSFFSVLAKIDATLVMFEGASRLAGSLADMADVLGNREAAVARELTKMFEEVRRGTLSDLADSYAREGPPRGEMAVVVGPPLTNTSADAQQVDAAINAADPSSSVKDVAAEIADRFGLKRRDVYARALELRGRHADRGS